MKIQIVEMIDIPFPQEVEIKVDGRKMWVNVDGICRLRILMSETTIQRWEVADGQ